MLPVWDIVGNDSQLVGGLLPLTVLWSYAVFAVINLLAIAIYATVGKEWVAWIEQHAHLVESRHQLSRRQKVLTDLTLHEHRYAEGGEGR